MADYKKIEIKQDRFVKKSIFSAKTIMAVQVADIHINCDANVANMELYTFHLGSGEKIQFHSGEVTLDSVDVKKFACVNQIPYQYGFLKGVVYTDSIVEVRARVERAFPRYCEYGKELIKDKFGEEYDFLVEEKFKEYSWKFDYWLGKNGEKAAYLGRMNLSYLSKYDPKAGVYEYAMTPPLMDIQTGKDALQVDVDKNALLDSSR